MKHYATYTTFREVDGCLSCVFLRNRFNKQAGIPNKVLVVYAKASFVVGEGHVLRPGIRL